MQKAEAEQSKNELNQKHSTQKTERKVPLSLSLSLSLALALALALSRSRSLARSLSLLDFVATSDAWRERRRCTDVAVKGDSEADEQEQLR
eukprot:SAG11_NODE_1284_length_5305_cov_1.528621_4_plen_91_part_00